MKTPSLTRLLAIFTVLIVTSFATHAQTNQELADATVKAIGFYKDGRCIEAIPYFEVVLKAIPDSDNAHFMYGKCLLFKSKQTKNTDEAKQLSAKALDEFNKAKQLGLKNPENDTLITLLSGKATVSDEGPTYSLNKEADKLMVDAENFFAQSNYDEAIKKYEKALALDPNIYQAALGLGDCYTQKSDWARAEIWYQRGIAIDPMRETAYRYSGTPLMQQNKTDEARERYIEAYITEPYNNMSRRGITQWAQVTGMKLGHPNVDIPVLNFDSAGKATPQKAINADDAAARPWLAYLLVRESWHKEKFAKTFPDEREYRHTLQEEAEALHAVALAAAEQKATGPSFDWLTKMDREGLLESYVLLARADEGISKDHPAYLKLNRPKLHQYVATYVIRK